MSDNPIHEQIPPSGVTPEIWDGLSDEVKAALGANAQLPIDDESYEKFYAGRDRTTIGQLYAALNDERLTDDGLLKITEVAKELLYSCLCHDDVDVEECRSMMGPVSDAVWDECEMYDPRPGAPLSYRG